MDYETIAYEVEDHVLTITLDRPEKMNAMTVQMGLDLVDAFDRSDADDEVRAVIITGRGRAFCAGADLSGGESTFDRVDTDQIEDIRDEGGLVTLRMFDSHKPIIAAVNG